MVYGLPIYLCLLAAVTFPLAYLGYSGVSRGATWMYGRRLVGMDGLPIEVDRPRLHRIEGDSAVTLGAVYLLAALGGAGIAFWLAWMSIG